MSYSETKGIIGGLDNISRFFLIFIHNLKLEPYLRMLVKVFELKSQPKDID